MSKSNRRNNVTPARKDAVQHDATCQQQRQFVVDVGSRVVSQPASRTFRCTPCDRQFASRKYLTMHMALHKMAADPPPTLSSVGGGARTAERQASRGSVPQQTLSCPICGKTFLQNSNFRNHVRTHSDARPYVCLVCLIGFKECYHLKKHTLFKHSPGQLNEACRLCGKRFKDLTAVRAHERTHSNVRPYACSRCDKMFKTNECLWHHENRSKSCSGGTRSTHCYEVNTSTGGQSSSACRQRLNRSRSLPSTTPKSTIKSTGAAATLPTRCVESTTAEAPTSSPPNAARCAVASGVKWETESAELFDCDVGALWKTTTSDSVALQSICGDNVDTDFCTSANCFDTLMTVTDDGSGGDVVERCGEQFWNPLTPTDLSSQNNRRLPSSIVVVSRDAAFQTVSGYRERRPRDQTTSGDCVQLSGANEVIDVQTIPSCSTMINDCEHGRSLKQSTVNSQGLFQPAGSSGEFCDSNQAVPTSAVSPIKHASCRGITATPLHVVLPPTAKTFHLPPIETFAPRRRPR